jgi:hypothetical protein
MEPSDADARAARRAMPGPQRRAARDDASDHLVTRDDRGLARRQLAEDHVQVGPADGARLDRDDELVGRGDRLLDVEQAQSAVRDRSGPLDSPRPHAHLPRRRSL